MVGRTENFVPVFAIEFDIIMRCYHNVQEKNGVGMAVCPHISSQGPQDRFLNNKFWEKRERGIKYSRRVDKGKNNEKSERRFTVGKGERASFC
jgi:hypothetical protein